MINVLKVLGTVLGFVGVLCLLCVYIASHIGFVYIVVLGLIYVNAEHGLGWCITGSIISVLFGLKLLFGDN